MCAFTFCLHKFFFFLLRSFSGVCLKIKTTMQSHKNTVPNILYDKHKMALYLPSYHVHTFMYLPIATKDLLKSHLK